MVPLHNGIGRGYFALNEDFFPEGNYTLRAYSNWMRNFDKKCIFQQQFTINNYSGDAWLIHARFQTAAKDINRVEAALQFKQQDERPLSFRNLMVSLTDGTKTWHRNTFQTDVYGNLTFNFKIPAKANTSALYLQISPSSKNATEQTMTIPMLLKRKPNIDLQFMSEGGELIAGIKNRIAFKAIGENGLGQAVSGVIYDSRQQVIDSFYSSHLGMGHFELIPKKNERYTAAIQFQGTRETLIPLPTVKDMGTALRVTNPLHSDSIEIVVRFKAEHQAANRVFYLVAQARGIACLGAKITLKSNTDTLQISKSLFPSGIARFTLYDTTMRPLNQRMIFINNSDDQLLTDITGHEQYGPRDKVNLRIKVSDITGHPIQGSFSVAVTDDNKVYIDPLKRNSMVSEILLTSDLNGYVENPGYYFPRHMTAQIWRDLDNLLLTQGWVTFSRDTTSPPQYQAEQAFSIDGTVTNILNKPVAGSQVLLFSKKPFLLEETTTNTKGAFSFRPLYPLDTASYMLQARNKKGKSFNIGITVNPFKPPKLTPLISNTLPWYVNIDTVHANIVNTQMADKELEDKLLGKHVLKEVVIVGQKAIPESKNLNGPGGSDFVLNQSDMEKEGKTTLGEVLRQRVKGFRLGGKRLDLYLINSEMVHLIIDGVNLDFFKPDDASYKDFYQSYLNYLTAEDIKGIEVMLSAQYTAAYFQKFLDPMADPFEHVFIEITTYSGNGAFLKRTPGVFLYKPPMAFNTPAHFYAPKYTVKKNKDIPDLRSSIYWAPDITTNKKGEAEISFYTADKTGTYTLIMEGTDMNGHIESIIKKIRIH